MENHKRDKGKEMQENNKFNQFLQNLKKQEEDSDSKRMMSRMSRDYRMMRKNAEMRRTEKKKTNPQRMENSLVSVGLFGRSRRKRRR